MCKILAKGIQKHIYGFLQDYSISSALAICAT